MSEPSTSSSDVHPVYALLPWYASGKLGAEQALQVEHALQNDPALRASLQRIEEERDEDIALNETISSPSGDLDRLMARIEAEAPRRDRTASRDVGIFAWVLERIGRLSPAGIAYAGAALALVIVAQSGALVGLLAGPQRDHTQEIGASPRSEAEAGRSVIVVRFVPGATLEAAMALLQSEQATISAGPDAAGDFRVIVTAARADAAVADLLAHKELVQSASK